MIHAIFCSMGATAIAGAPGPSLQQMLDYVYTTMLELGRRRLSPPAAAFDHYDLPRPGFDEWGQRKAE